jgi:hypothetical protein
LTIGDGDADATKVPYEMPMEIYYLPRHFVGRRQRDVQVPFTCRPFCKSLHLVRGCHHHPSSMSAVRSLITLFLWMMMTMMTRRRRRELMMRDCER